MQKRTILWVIAVIMLVTGSNCVMAGDEKPSGTYIEAEASATLVKGVGGMWLENSNGVILHMKSNNDGVALAIQAEGLKITMK